MWPFGLQPVSLPLRGHLAMSGNICDCRALEATIGIWWAEARGAADIPERTGQSLNRESPGPREPQG